MMSRLYILAVFVVCVCRGGDAFKMMMKTSQPTLQKSMLKKFSGIACAACIMISSVSGVAGPALAAVGEGDLPDGAMAFQKLLKYQVFMSRLFALLQATAQLFAPSKSEVVRNAVISCIFDADPFLSFHSFQGEWDKLAGSVKNREKEIDEKEVLSIKVFLKQLANEFYDMELLSKSINDPVKQKDAKEIAKVFRLEIRECDDAAGKGNIAKIIELYPKTATELKDFFGLMQDVPDEI